MRLRNVKNAKDIVKNSPFVVQNPQQHKGKYKELFGNNNPIHLEIGMGKGNFILDKAKKNPDINFIGLEKYDSIVCRALEKDSSPYRPLPYMFHNKNFLLSMR